VFLTVNEQVYCDNGLDLTNTEAAKDVEDVTKLSTRKFEDRYVDVNHAMFSQSEPLQITQEILNHLKAAKGHTITEFSNKNWSFCFKVEKELNMDVDVDEDDDK